MGEIFEPVCLLILFTLLAYYYYYYYSYSECFDYLDKAYDRL